MACIIQANAYLAELTKIATPYVKEDAEMQRGECVIDLGGSQHKKLLRRWMKDGN